MPKNFKHLINNTNCMPVIFQCKHSCNYDDVLFHIFVDCMMPAPGGGAEPEYNMCQALILLMKENIDKVEQIAQPFLSRKN